MTRTPFIGLAALVRRLQASGLVPALQRGIHPRTDPELYGQLTALAVEVFGSEAVLSAPALLNAAGLTFRLGNPMTVWSPRPAAVRLAHDTELRSLPAGPPKLFRTHAFLVEVRKPDRETLFGQTVALGGYWMGPSTSTQPGERLFLLGLQYPDGVACAEWRPTWASSPSAVAVVPSRPGDPSTWIDSQEGLGAWLREAVTWAVTFGILLEADQAPLREEVERERIHHLPNSGGGAPRAPSEWVTRHLYLETRPAPTGAHRESEPAETSLVGRLPAETTVRGHVRYVPCGPGRTGRRWAYVAPFTAIRWHADRPTRVVVHRDAEDT